LNLPEFTLRSSGFNFPQPVGPAVISDPSGNHDLNFTTVTTSRPAGEKANAPPIYLQKLSLLI
jgi:hypothetical protein